MVILDVDITPVTLIQNLLRTQLHTLYIYNEPLDLTPVVNNELKQLAQLYDDHLHINNRLPDAVFCYPSTLRKMSLTSIFDQNLTG